MSETLKYEQMSIYDFLHEGESQELPPSETVAQVDEAQVVHWEPSTDEEFESYNKACSYPSSDLGTKCPNCMNYPMIDGECMGLHCGYKIPTEDTDSTLFSVGDTVKIRQASEFYTPDSDPESYYFLKDREGLEGVILKIVEGEQFIIKFGTDGEWSHFYAKELQKI